MPSRAINQHKIKLNKIKSRISNGHFSKEHSKFKNQMLIIFLLDFELFPRMEFVFEAFFFKLKYLQRNTVSSITSCTERTPPCTI